MKPLSFLVAAALPLALASCQKVISLEVSEAASQVVIVGEITDTVSQWKVSLSRSIRYDSANAAPAISGAQVTIRDAAAGTIDTLAEVFPGSGLYLTASPKMAAYGHSYELTVRTGGTTYTATSTLPAHVPFDSLYTETNSGFGGSFRLLYPVFTDPAGVSNYYRFFMYVNGRRQNFDVRDDRLSDGRVNGRPIFPDNQDSVKAGDLLTVDMQCLDKAAYEYFRSFSQADGSGSAPANPITNIQGGALGYFAAMTSQRRSVTAR